MASHFQHTKPPAPIGAVQPRALAPAVSELACWHGDTRCTDTGVETREEPAP